MDLSRAQAPFLSSQKLLRMMISLMTGWGLMMVLVMGLFFNQA